MTGAHAGEIQPMEPARLSPADFAAAALEQQQERLATAAERKALRREVARHKRALPLPARLGLRRWGR